MIKIKNVCAPNSMELNRVFNAIILNEPYAGWVLSQTKTIETRMRKLDIVGDLVICCDKGKSKKSNYAGKALCIVEVVEMRGMRIEDERSSCIAWMPGRIAYPLTRWRLFNRQFDFIEAAVTRNWQGVFKLKLPDDICTIELEDFIASNDKNT